VKLAMDDVEKLCGRKWGRRGGPAARWPGITTPGPHPRPGRLWRTSPSPLCTGQATGLHSLEPGLAPRWTRSHWAMRRAGLCHPFVDRLRRFCTALWPFGNIFCESFAANCAPRWPLPAARTPP